MAEPFLGEIRMMSFDFPPKGWAECDGQLLPINQNQALFALLGTTFGGDGRTNFALPDLRSRTPIHAGNGHALGESAGEQNHTLASAEMPAHDHLARVASASNQPSPKDNFLGEVANFYGSPASLTPINPATVSPAGGSQPHQNMQPFLTCNFCISLAGIFPSRN